MRGKTAHLSNDTYSVRPYSWQAYGYYADHDGRPLFATAVRASNPYMARAAIMAHRVLSPDAVITSLKPIDTVERI